MFFSLSTLLLLLADTRARRWRRERCSPWYACVRCKGEMREWREESKTRRSRTSQVYSNKFGVSGADPINTL